MSEAKREIPVNRKSTPMPAKKNKPRPPARYKTISNHVAGLGCGSDCTSRGSFMTFWIGDGALARKLVVVTPS